MTMDPSRKFRSMRRLFLPIYTTPQLFFSWLNILVLNDRLKKFSVHKEREFSFKLPIELKELRGQYLIQVTGEFTPTNVAPRITEIPLFNFEIAQKRPSEITLVYEFYRDDCEDFKSWFDEMIAHLVFDFPEAQSKPDLSTDISSTIIEPTEVNENIVGLQSKPIVSKPDTQNVAFDFSEAQSKPDLSTEISPTIIGSTVMKKIVRLQTKPAGRKVDPYNDECWEIISEGGGSVNAWKKAFDYWCEKKKNDYDNLKKQQQVAERNAFKKAMNRAQLRTLKNQDEIPP